MRSNLKTLLMSLLTAICFTFYVHDMAFFPKMYGSKESMCSHYVNLTFQHYNMETKTSTNEGVTMMDVYKEFNDRIAEHYKILQYKSRKVE